MNVRLRLRTPWFTHLYDNSPVYLYWSDVTEDFEIATYGTARKHKFIFSEDELAQMKKDYDLSPFVVEYIKRRG